MPGIESPGERVSFLLLPHRELIEHDRHVLHSKHEVFEITRFSEHRRTFGGRGTTPHRIVAAGMLEEDGDVASCRPVFAEEGAALPVAAEPMAEKHDGRGLRRGGKINAQRQVAAATGIADGEFDRGASGADGQRVVSVQREAGDEEENKGEAAHGDR